MRSPLSSALAAVFILGLAGAPTGCGGKTADPAKKAGDKTATKAGDKADPKAADKADLKAAEKTAEPVAKAATTKDAPTASVAATSKPGAALANIPKSTHGVFVVSNPGAIWTTHVIPGLSNFPEFKKALAQAGAASEMLLGADATDMSGLRKLGLDPAGEIGAFSIDPTQSLMGGFVTLSDAATFKTTLKNLGAKSKMELAFTKVGEAEIVSFKRNVLVLKGNNAYVVWQDRWGPEAEAVAALMVAAKSIAETTAATGVTSRSDFTDRMKSVGTDGNVRGWADIGGLVALVLKKAQARKAEPTPKHMVEGLTKAKAAKDSASIKQAEDRIAQHRKWEDRWQQRHLAEAQAIKAIFGSLTTAAWNHTADDAGLHGALKIGAKAGNPWSKMLKNISGPSVTAMANSGPSIFTAHGSLDKGALMEWATMLAAAEGEDLNKGRAELKSKLGIDFDTDIWAAIGDEVGIAINLDLSKLFSTPRDQRIKMFGGAFVLKLTDEAKLKALVKKLIPPAAAELVTMDEAKGTWSVDVPLFKKVHLTIANGWLSVSTDAGFHTRLKTPAAKGFTHKHPGVQTVLGAKNVAGIFALEQLAMVAAQMADRSQRPPVQLKDGANESMKKLHAAYLVDRLKLNELRETRRRARDTQMVETVGRVGTTAFSVGVAPEELTIQGGQFITGTMAELITALATLGMSKKSRRGDSSEEMKLDDKVWKLEQALNNGGRGAPVPVSPTKGK